jgi:hypothetical protein
MKKLLILLALVILVTGCSVNQVEKKDYTKLVNEILVYNTDLSNRNYSGYKFYLPRGVSLINKNNYNFVLLYKGTKMYMYVDVVAYYHKVQTEYTVNKDIYYSVLLEKDNKRGYINITKVEDKMFYVDMEYNYAKIEAYVKENNLSSTLRQMCIILNSFKYNDKIIASMIGENQISYEEEEFSLFKSEGNSDDYLETADGKEIKTTKELIDDENLDINDFEF